MPALITEKKKMSLPWVEVDGSIGEGGGQILRSSLTLSMATGKPFHMTGIRANRVKPGLGRQHLTSVKAAARICGARVSGAAIGSQELRFEPRSMTVGEYAIDVGSAGSTTLVCQTVLPALCLLGKPFRLSFFGGTHNGMAPCLDFFEQVYLARLQTMGLRFELLRKRRGFYPAGGGEWHLEVHPPARFAPVHLMERGAFRGLQAVIMAPQIPRDVAIRQQTLLCETLGLRENQVRIDDCPDSMGPGNVVLLQAHYEHCCEMITHFGARTILAEHVARGAIAELRDYQKTLAPVGEHLADQLLLPMALGQGGCFLTGRMSSHLKTNLHTLRLFLPQRFLVQENADGTTRLEWPGD
jgi:RNA 3'-terminal phosphate cyclase (ATP)